jgi:hypothetical protein
MLINTSGLKTILGIAIVLISPEKDKKSTSEGSKFDPET